MTTAVKSETLDRIYAEARNAKIAEPYTWAQIFQRILWKKVLYLTFVHIGFATSLIFYSFGFNSIPVKWQTWVWMFGAGYLASICGITAGAHRLWSHRTYKANLYLRILLMCNYSTTGLYSIFHWIRDHRIHHKFVDTDADPHNAKRGFFFSHIGWLLIKRHPENVRQSRKIDMSDILDDPVVVFSMKNWRPLMLIFFFVIPTTIPVIFWGETILHAVLTQYFIRYGLILNFTWSVNSVAHLWGDRPYNRYIDPVDNLMISLLTAGEGSHNYHHTFPWDYKTSELPRFTFNLTTAFINAMAKLGWAYDLREASPELIEKVTQRIGYKSIIDGIH